MTDVVTLLHELVDHPVATPAPLESLLERGRRRRLRRMVAAGGVSMALVAGVLGLAAMIGGPGPGPVRVRVTGPGVKQASYRSTASGGYLAKGEWSLTIVRDGKTINYASGSSPACGDNGTIRPGDRVLAEIRSDSSSLEVGQGVTCRSSQPSQ
jgi:hypothetical protein